MCGGGRSPTTKAWVVVAVAVGSGAALRFGSEAILRVLDAFGRFFNRLFSQFSNRDFAILMSVQFLTQAGQGMIQGAIGKSIAFGGQEGFDVQNVPSADYLLQVVLLLYVPYTLLSPFIGVVIDRFDRRRVVWWSNLITAGGRRRRRGRGPHPARVGQHRRATSAATAALDPRAARRAGRDPRDPRREVRGDPRRAVRAATCCRAMLVSQAGGALFQIVGIAFALAARRVPPGVARRARRGGRAVVVGAFAATRLRHVEARPHATSFSEEARRVLRTIAHGIKEVAARPAAAVGLSGFQMLRYQFWGFGLFVFALYAKNLVEGGADSQVPTLLSGAVGLIGGVLGLDRRAGTEGSGRTDPAPAGVDGVSSAPGTLVFGGLVSVAGFAAMLFVGFFAFFVGKISADTIVQQAMPDDFRGARIRAVRHRVQPRVHHPGPHPVVRVDRERSRDATRVVLVASGAVFLAAHGGDRRVGPPHRDQFAPQDDVIEA